MVSFTRLTIAAFEKLPLSGHRDLRTPGRFRRLLYWATGVALAPAADPLLPAEVLCTSALTLIIGTYASYFAQTSTPMLLPSVHSGSRIGPKTPITNRQLGKHYVGKCIRPRQELPSHRRPQPQRNPPQSILFCTDIYTDAELALA